MRAPPHPHHEVSQRPRVAPLHKTKNPVMESQVEVLHDKHMVPCMPSGDIVACPAPVPFPPRHAKSCLCPPSWRPQRAATHTHNVTVASTSLQYDVFVEKRRAAAAGGGGTHQWRAWVSPRPSLLSSLSNVYTSALHQRGGSDGHSSQRVRSLREGTHGTKALLTNSRHARTARCSTWRLFPSNT